MKLADVDYVRAETLDHALALIAAQDAETRVLAGGQSLMPLLAMRLAAPARLVDINRLAELERLEIVDGRLVIGALVRHHRIATDPAGRTRGAAADESRAACRPSGDPQPRHLWGIARPRGPRLGVPGLRAGARRGDHGWRRRGDAAACGPPSFSRGCIRRPRARDELLLEVSVPVATEASRFAFEEFSRRSGDYALAGLAAAAQADGGRLTAVRLALFGIGDTPVLATEAAAILESAPVTDALVKQAVATLDG